jgi:hypothetical protein
MLLTPSCAAGRREQVGGAGLRFVWSLDEYIYVTQSEKRCARLDLAVGFTDFSCRRVRQDDVTKWEEQAYLYPMLKQKQVRNCRPWLTGQCDSNTGWLALIIGGFASMDQVT